MVWYGVLGLIGFYVAVFIGRLLANSIREVSKWDRRSGDY